MKVLPPDAGCPCGTGKTYGECCGPFHAGTAVPATAEQLMRSRYTAYVLMNIPYLITTVHPSKLGQHNPAQILETAQNTQWKGLKILAKRKGGSGDATGMVEFKAFYEENGKLGVLHELSDFVKLNGRWVYLEGRFR